jgi:ADP-dependent phosphofructokinase/glucokinase
MDLDLKALWGDRYKEATKTKLDGKSVLCAYNAVVDYVEFVNPKHVSQLVAQTGGEHEIWVSSQKELDHVENGYEFLSVLIHAMREGKALHFVCGNPLLFEWFNKAFSGPDKKRIGGQAGIIANQLCELGANAIVWTPRLSKHLAELLHSARVRVPVAKGKKLVMLPPRSAYDKEAATKVNWIFEFKANDALEIDGKTVVAPRSNRVIIASEAKIIPTFSDELVPLLPKLGQSVQAAIMAGYHYLDPICSASSKNCKFYLDKEKPNLHALKSKNPELIRHYEYVPIPHAEVEKQIISTIIAEIDSLGVNEVEARELLERFGYKKDALKIYKLENAFTLYLGALKLLRKLGLKRLHLHNLGYHLILLKKPYRVAPEKVRDSCLFASAVGAAKALKGGFVTKKDVLDAARFPMSDTGINQVYAFASFLITELRLPKDKFNPREVHAEGIVDMGDHYIILTPSPILSKPATTVGLGDVVSSAALAAEL